MATTAENKARIDAIVNNSVRIDSSDFTAQDKKDLYDALFPGGAKIHYLNPLVSVGDNVFGNPDDPLIPGFSWDAEVLSLPLTSVSNLKNLRKW